MATLVANIAYKDGHQVILKDPLKIPVASRSKFVAAGYAPGKSVFSLVRTIPSKKPDINIELSLGPASIYLMDEKSKLIKVVGTSSSINGTFNHYSKNAKSDTGVLTEIKENVSMWVFESYFEHSEVMSEDRIIAKLPSNQRDGLYDTIYYESAIKQLNALKSLVKSRGYNYERQGKTLTAKLYTTARKLTKKANDNWNPADVWMIKKNYNMTPLYNATSAEELNELLAVAYKNLDIIPISLKQVTSSSAKLSVVDPASMMNTKIDFDLTFNKIDLSDTFANFIISTNSGFAVRCGYKASASTLNVSLEGRFVGAGYQLGAVDAKAFGPYIQSKFQYNVRSGIGVTSQHIDTAKNELKEIFKKYSRISNTIATYDQAIAILTSSNELTKQRFANLISYLYAYTIATKNNNGFEELMKYSYFSSKKVSSDSALYVILQ